MTAASAPQDRGAPGQPRPGRRVSTRRAAIATSLGVVAGMAVGGGVAAAAISGSSGRAEGGASSGSSRTSDVYGATQAGITRPAAPQPFNLTTVVDLADPRDLDFLPTLGRRIAELATRPPPGLLPDGPMGLTVTVGLGPRAMAAVDPSLPGTAALPALHGDDDIPAAANGGDLLIACCADDPTILIPVTADLTGRIPGAVPRWSQAARRGPGSGGIARNPLGFRDNIVVPRGSAELAENVWLDGRLAGGTICVIRRLRLQIQRFAAMPVSDREAVIGRRLDTGAPLSGGGPDAQPDINAKHPNGAYKIPLGAHARVADPVRTGSHLMLRRGYGYDNGAGDAGLLFTCFQRDLDTFITTQRQLDAHDKLMGFATPTASGAFLVLPGFSANRPLGAALAG